MEVKLTDEQLYARMDELYGLPISSLSAKAFIAELRAQGFEGPESKLHPFGLPDAPEARLMQTWYLSKKLPGLEINVDVIGDYRDAVHNVEFMLVSLDGKPVTARASELLSPVAAGLSRPKVTKWFVTQSGKKHVEDFEGTHLESVGGSTLSWMYIVKGSASVVQPIAESVPNVPPKNDYHAMREWSDASGGFKVKASFVSLGNGHVKLKKEDGKVIDVSIDKLSIEDQEFINKLKH